LAPLRPSTAWMAQTNKHDRFSDYSVTAAGFNRQNLFFR
jgi:hypothetical protein